MVRSTQQKERQKNIKYTIKLFDRTNFQVEFDRNYIIWGVKWNQLDKKGGRFNPQCMCVCMHARGVRKQVITRCCFYKVIWWLLSEESYRLIENLIYGWFMNSQLRSFPGRKHDTLWGWGKCCEFFHWTFRWNLEITNMFIDLKFM